jgi:hypothetical protein
VKPARGHVDEQTLAACREGLLPARKAARVSAHLSTCQRCAEIDAQLAAVTTILARTPAPPMPASLAARLDAALAAEIARSAAAVTSGATSPAGAAAPAGAAQPAGAAPPAGAAGPGEQAGRRDGPDAGREAARRKAGPARAPWRLSLRLSAAAAAVVVLTGGGYAIARVVSAGNPGGSAGSYGAPASRGAIGGPSASGRGPEAAPGIATGGRRWSVAAPTTEPASCRPRSVPSSSATPPPRARPATSGLLHPRCPPSPTWPRASPTWPVARTHG